MTTSSLLEQRLQTLIQEFVRLKKRDGEQAQRLAAKDRRLVALEGQVRKLRAQIDDMGKERLTLKQLKEERKVMRRNLEMAMNRLAALEQELS